MYIEHYPALLSATLCSELIVLINNELNLPLWQTDNPFVPRRQAKYISALPSLGAIILKQFKHLRIDQEGTVYFAHYPRGSGCLPHVDPENLTVIIELKTADSGGVLSVNGETQSLGLGGAVLFRGEYPHEVSTVTAGERYSLSIWFK